MSGTHVSANQGGCTVWCDDCGEAHNCESWSENRTLAWTRQHKCRPARERRISDALACLRKDDVPKALSDQLKALAGRK